MPPYFSSKVNTMFCQNKSSKNMDWILAYFKSSCLCLLKEDGWQIFPQWKNARIFTNMAQSSVLFWLFHLWFFLFGICTKLSLWPGLQLHRLLTNQAQVFGHFLTLVRQKWSGLWENHNETVKNSNFLFFLPRPQVLPIDIIVIRPKILCPSRKTF